MISKPKLIIHDDKHIDSKYKVDIEIENKCITTLWVDDIKKEVIDLYLGLYTRDNGLVALFKKEDYEIINNSAVLEKL